MAIAFYIITGFALFAILWLVNKAIQSAIANNRIHQLFQRILPVVEFSLWFLYIIWALNGIFSHWGFYDILMYAVIISIIIGIGWFIAKDFIAGVVLKSELPFQTNQHISLPQTEGKLKKLGYRSLEIETESGQIVKIPYSRLTNEIITCQSNPEGLKFYETTIKLESSRKKEDICDLITEKIMLLPWTIPSKKPTIKPLNDKDQQAERYLIKFFAANPRHAEKISHYIKEYSEKLNGKKQ